MKLTLKQKAFADYYIATGNATESAISAGYSPKTAYSIGDENLKKPVIKKYIDECIAQIDSERIADAKEIMEFHTKVLRGELEEDIVVVEGVGDGCSEARLMTKPASLRDRQKSAEHLAKILGIAAENINVTIAPVIKDDIPS